jgi:hypothetical protein
MLARTSATTQLSSWRLARVLAIEPQAACMARLQALGNYEFNAVYRETFVFMLPSWTTAAAVEHLLENHPSKHRSGDIYARLRG